MTGGDTPLARRFRDAGIPVPPPRTEDERADWERRRAEAGHTAQRFYRDLRGVEPHTTATPRHQFEEDPMTADTDTRTTTEWGVLITWHTDPDEPALHHYDTREEAEQAAVYYVAELSDATAATVDIVARTVTITDWQVAA